MDSPGPEEDVQHPSDAYVAEIPGLVANLNASDSATRLETVRRLRRLLSIERNPPISIVIDAGGIPPLMSLLYSEDTVFLLEAAWCLCNIASGTSAHCEELRVAGAIPAFVMLLSHANIEVVAQAVWALGNMAGDSARMRDACLEAGCVQPVVWAFTRAAGSVPTTRNIVWAASNLVRGKPKPDMSVVGPLATVFASAVMNSDSEVCTDGAWGLSYLSDGPNEHIDVVLSCVGVVQRLVTLVSSQNPAIVTPVLRTLGNIATGDEHQTDQIVHSGLLQVMPVLLEHPKRTVVKEAVWTLSNIAAGSAAQVTALANSGLLAKVIELMKDAPFEVAKEACWTISNCTDHKLPGVVQTIVALGGLEALVDKLSLSDNRMVRVALEGIEHILEAGQNGGDQVNDYALPMEACGALEVLEGLQSHSDESIVRKSRLIINAYLGGEEVRDDEQDNGN